ncbi:MULTISPECIES: hypothetical protein [Sorangium]|uniref:PGRS family protein n=1 Tax=Sorangium cellulosum TaxID=56 RepID=A0A4P2QGX8_SORCE|nr:MULTISPECIES: hypothetical protein [Sorangium]AUX29207.1 hypothetical protein SOCE836_012950 [Sorangium cellulosum]WCQ88599.1 hypothetical protein NQZ70_01278 [Sorangium sp. Soce836]
MRRASCCAWALVALAMSSGIYVAGCFPFPLNYNCENTYTDCSSGAGGAGGDASPTCDADPTQDASTVTEDCAVFASASAKPGGDGTRAKPYASLAEAIANANGKRVLACASGAFAESVTIEAGVEVIGGFDCGARWTWSKTARSEIEAPADEIALTLAEGASGAKVRSFAVRAASATVPGGSSIGVAVADVEAELAQVDVTAGDGMDGAKGETPMGAPQPGAPAGAVSNACALVLGGEAGVTTCEDGETSGGPGGRGGSPGIDDGNGQRGEDGAPLPEENPNNRGLGGIGQTDAAGECRRGEDGKSGDAGIAGDAGSSTTLTLDGIAGGDGGKGMNGTRGQGGGGGGGAKAGLFCQPGAEIVEGPGASGGGGGAGGCGGKGGGGGKAGGSSVGILSLGTKLVLTEVTVAVGRAGKGGNGADGQNGANGGAGASGGTASDKPPSIPGCDGGRGGRGGAGGPGAGGRGGHAIGIAYAATPSDAPAVQFAPGTPGDGGSAAPGGPQESAGAPGNAGSCWDFATGKGCGQ